MWSRVQSAVRTVWKLAEQQHGVISRAQLLELGFSRRSIEHRIARGRLHQTPFRGVYAVGRPELTCRGAMGDQALVEATDPRVHPLGDPRVHPPRSPQFPLLAKHAFTLTDSELERLFLRIVRKAKLPIPETQQWIGDRRVDFYWPALKLIVEADSLRSHRTAAQQLTDRRRDQAHAVLGLTTLRFTHFQFAREPEHVSDTLVAVISARQ